MDVGGDTSTVGVAFLAGLVGAAIREVGGFVLTLVNKKSEANRQVRKDTLDEYKDLLDAMRVQVGEQDEKIEKQEQRIQSLISSNSRLERMYDRATSHINHLEDTLRGVPGVKFRPWVEPVDLPGTDTHRPLPGEQP